VQYASQLRYHDAFFSPGQITRMRSIPVTLFQTFFSICRFRSGPQDLPTSSHLLSWSLILYTLCSIVISLINLPPGQAVTVAILNTLLLALTMVALLQLSGYRERIVQTLTALCGAGIVLSIIGFPIIFWLNHARLNQQGTALPSLLWLALFAWDLLVMAHVLRHAVSIRFSFGLLLSVIYIWIVFNVIYLIIPHDI